MEQRRLDFNNDESHRLYLQLDKEHQQSLIGLMVALITTVFQEQEKTHDAQSQHANKDQC